MNAQAKVKAVEPSPHMAIWDAVSKTDPSHTKRVNQRGGFTAIAAHSQIMSATRQFGPIGIGWGYINGDPVFTDGIVIVPVTIWHGERTNEFGPLFGGADMFDSRGKVDSDAPKKAATDGLTKGLSQLGFNADVFLGLFDDNKYVQQVAREFAEQTQDAPQEPAVRQKLDGPHTSKTALRAAVHAAIAKVRAAQSADEISAIVKENKRTIDQAKRDWPILIDGDPSIEEDGGLRGALAARKSELAMGENETFAMLIRGVEQCDTLQALNSFLETNDAILAELDGAESRAFQDVWDKRETAIRLMNQVAA